MVAAAIDITHVSTKVENFHLDSNISEVVKREVSLHFSDDSDINLENVGQEYEYEEDDNSEEDNYNDIEDDDNDSPIYEDDSEIEETTFNISKRSGHGGKKVYNTFSSSNSSSQSSPSLVSAVSNIRPTFHSDSESYSLSEGGSGLNLTRGSRIKSRSMSDSRSESSSSLSVYASISSSTSTNAFNFRADSGQQGINDSHKITTENKNTTIKSPVSHENDKYTNKLKAENETTPDNVTNTADTIGDYKGRPSACIFVASLASSLPDDQLCMNVTKHFQNYGQLVGVKVLRDDHNRPYAFVQYINDKDAKHALKNASGTVLNGRKLRCEAAKVNRTLLLINSKPIEYTEVIDFCNNFGKLEVLVPGKQSSSIRQGGGFNKLAPFRSSIGINIKQNQHNSLDNSTVSTSWFTQFVFREDAIRAFANIKDSNFWDVQWVQNVEVSPKYNLLNRADQFVKRNPSNDSNERDSDDFEKDEKAKYGSTFSLNARESDFQQDTDSVSTISSASKSNDKIAADLKFAYRQINTRDKFQIDKKSIFVGQLDLSTTKEILVKRFSTHGKIRNIDVVSKPTTVFAFIEYETEQAAAAALDKENHSILLSKTMHVQYKEIGGPHGRRLFKRNSYFKEVSKTFTPPEANLAPPPINMYKRMVSDNDSTLIPFPYIGYPLPEGIHEIDIVPFSGNPYIKAGVSDRNISATGHWSSVRSNSNQSTIADVSSLNINNTTSLQAKDITSETRNGGTTLDGDKSQSSDGEHHVGSPLSTTSTEPLNSSEKQNFNRYNNGTNGSYTYVSRRKFISRRNGYGYNEPPRNCFFPPYVYPFQYPIGSIHAGPNASGNHPYMMVYPLPPPPPPPHSGIKNSIIPPTPLGIPQSNTSIPPMTSSSSTQYMSTDSPKFIPEKKKQELEY